jgi:hypothetical protein
MNNNNYSNNLIPIKYLNNIFNDKIKNNNYDYIYISIGSKYVDNNSCYAKDQMVPNFVRRLTDKKILIVIIDDFNDNDNYHFNSNLINEQLAISNSSNIDVLIANGFFYSYLECEKKYILNKKFVTNFFSFNELNKINFNPCFITIANFVKFEKYFEENKIVQDNMSRLITKYIHEKYKYSFFEWSGYNMLGEFLYPSHIEPMLRDKTLYVLTLFFINRNINTKKINMNMLLEPSLMEYFLLNNNNTYDVNEAFFYYFNYVENQYKHNETYWMKNILDDVTSLVVKRCKIFSNL